MRTLLHAKKLHTDMDGNDDSWRVMTFSFLLVERPAPHLAWRHGTLVSVLFNMVMAGSFPAAMPAGVSRIISVGIY